MDLVKTLFCVIHILYFIIFFISIVLQYIVWLLCFANRYYDISIIVFTGYNNEAAEYGNS